MVTSLHLRLHTLAQKYREAESTGRKYERLHVSTEGFEALHPKPLGVKKDFTCYVLGYPLPNQELTGRLGQLSQQLTQLTDFNKDTFFYNQPDTFHVTLMGFKTGDAYGQTIATPHNPRFLKSVKDKLRTALPLTIYFDRVILTETGHLLVAGFPQDSQIFYLRSDFNKTYPEYVHLTLAYPLKQFSAGEHSLLISIIDQFNQQAAGGLGQATFEAIQVFHQIREYFTEVKLLERINLGQARFNHDG